MSVCKLDKGNVELEKNDQQIADVLNDYFASVFEVEEDKDLSILRKTTIYTSDKT